MKNNENKSLALKTIKENDIHAKKKFGQNFLNDNKILESIVNVSEVDRDTLVIEVGPGLGSLTEFLCKKAGFVLAYEIDTDLLPILDENLKSYDNWKVINKDILEVNIEEDISIYKKSFTKVYLVANLPYYITTPIILGLLEKTKMITRYVVMMQKEVADRICGTPKTKDYNALSVAIKYRAVATLEIKVPRTCFIPAPNVDSAVCKIDLYENSLYNAINEEHFFKFVRLCFSQRRKTLTNNLSSEYSKVFINKMYEDNNLKPTVRAEELDVADFVKLSDYIVNMGE